MTPSQGIEASLSPLSLPRAAHFTVNRCNLPPQLIGSLAFQQHPQALYLDGVQELHQALFTSLGSENSAKRRSLMFHDYMRSAFLLDHLEEVGLNPRGNFQRPKANYLRLLRGWMFDADSQEAAVLKGWVESRFGLVTQYHQGYIEHPDDERYQTFQESRARGLYNTNALEAQIDLLYAYCQYELSREYRGDSTIQLYRGANLSEGRHSLIQLSPNQSVCLLNSLNSFSSSRERAECFGDALLKASVPLAKVLFFPDLLPGVLPGEEEYLVIGGLYRVQKL